MPYSNKFYEVMALLGCGYSVQTICDKAGLTYDGLCELAQEHNELKIELMRWFPRYDFAVKQTEINEVKDKADEVSTGKQSKQRATKGKPE